MKDSAPCGHHQIEMEAQAEMPTIDQSVYGLVVFLVIFLLFATLTSGLLVCLSKIWCGFRRERDRPQQTLNDKQRRSILRSPLEDEDSDDESIQRTLSNRRFSQRIMSYVQKSLGDTKEKQKENGKEALEPKVSCGGVYTGERKVVIPIISTIEPSDGSEQTPQFHDPSTVVHV